jgi:hypothetical protein
VSLSRANGLLASVASLEAGSAPSQQATALAVAELSRRLGSLEAANAFSYKRSITVDNTAGPAKATPWPVKVALTAANMTFANARNDGRDIQFRAADGTVLPHWIASYDPVGQTAEIWVKAPTLASASITVTMRYGNPNWVSPFNIADVFPVGADFKDTRNPVGHPTLSAQSIIFSGLDAWESSSPAHSLDIVDFGTPGKLAPDGNIYRFWGWFGHYGSDGIGLALANSLSGPWTKYASNPVLPNATAATRWATVKQDDSGTLHLLVHNTTANTITRYTLSADGITPTLVETVVNDSGFTMGNPFLFRDPASGDYILWLFRQRVSDSLQQIGYRRASTIPGLTEAQTVVVQSSPVIWAAPAMVYFDGLYWLYTEDFDNSGQFWRTVVQTSPSPVGPFTPCANSILMAADQPCARAFVVDGVLYLFNAQRLNQANTPGTNWQFGVHTATPQRGTKTLPMVLSSPDALQSYSLYAQPQAQADTTLGAAATAALSGRVSGVGDTTNVSKSILGRNMLPAGCKLVARVARMATPNVFFGIRGSVAGARYRLDLGGNTAHIATSTGWHSGGTNIATAAVAGWVTGVYHVVEFVALSTTISANVDGAQVITVTHATYATGGYCAVEAPNGTDMSLDYVYARPWDGTDPTVTVGSEGGA